MNQEQVDAILEQNLKLEAENARLVMENDYLRSSEASARLSAPTPARLVSLPRYARDHGLSWNTIRCREERWRDRGFPAPVTTVPWRLYSEVDIDLFIEKRDAEIAAKRKEVDEKPWWMCAQSRESRRKSG